MEEIEAILLGLFVFAVALVILLIIPVVVLCQVIGVKRSIKELRKQLDSQKKTQEESFALLYRTLTGLAESPSTMPEPEIKLEPVAEAVKPEVKSAPMAAPAFAYERSQFQEKMETQADTINRKLSDIETRTFNVLARIWNWICVGEEFRSKGVSAEYSIATTWLIRIGVIVLLFGIGFFLKYSIDHSWISPAVRVAGMVAAGMALVGGGVYGSKGKYRPLAIALSGAGFVTLYLSVMAGFRLYHLIDAGPAFVLMVLITLASMIVAVGVNALLPAILGCAGGYLTPVFISTGSDNLPGLFLYLTILSAGTLIVSKYRDWLLLHIAAMVAYLVVGGAACISLLGDKNYLAVLALASLNYLIFAVQPLIRRGQKETTLIELFLSIANIAFYLMAMIPLALKLHDSIKLAALITLFCAAAAIAGMYWIRIRIPREKALLLLHMVIAAFALTLTMPFLLSCVWVVAAWSMMAFCMVYVACRMNSRVLLLLSGVMYIIAFLRGLGMNFAVATQETYLSALLDHFLTFGVYVLSMTASAVLLFTRKTPLFNSKPAEKKVSAAPSVICKLAIVFSGIAGLIFLAYSSWELVLFMECFVPWFRNGVLVLWWSVLAYGILLSALRFRIKYLTGPAILMFILSILMELACLDIGSSHGYLFLLRSHLLTVGVYLLSLTAAGYTVRRHLRKCSDPVLSVALLNKLSAGLFVTAGVLFFVYSSWEIHAALTEYLRALRNGGVSVWWGLFAVFLLYGGIRGRVKALRISAILLFVGCAVKVFLVDLAGLEQLWRIVAFIAIGGITLTGAVLYIRFKDQFTKESEPAQEDLK